MSKQNSCTHKKVIVDASALPFSCPPEHETLWNAHPRVYLPLHETARCVCPYCGTVYELRKERVSNAPVEA